MSFFESPLPEAYQRALIIKAATGAASISEIAKSNGFDVKALHDWVTLYKLHGEPILSPEQRAKAEVELFKLKYPQGKPGQGFADTVKYTLIQSKQQLFVLLVLLPGISWISTLFMSFLGSFKSLFMGALVSFIVMVLSWVIALVWMTFRISRHLVTGKIDEAVYVSEHRKVVSKQEVAGALQIAVNSDDLQGGLALAQEAGSLQESVSLESSERVLFDHAPDADVAIEEVAARDLGKKGW